MEVEDKVSWMVTKCDFFLVKSMYKACAFPRELVEKSCVQPKLCFFAWDLTLDQIQKRCYALINRCYLCQEYEC